MDENNVENKTSIRRALALKHLFCIFIGLLGRYQFVQRVQPLPSFQKTQKIRHFSYSFILIYTASSL